MRSSNIPPWLGLAILGLASLGSMIVSSGCSMSAQGRYQQGFDDGEEAGYSLACKRIKPFRHSENPNYMNGFQKGFEAGIDKCAKQPKVAKP